MTLKFERVYGSDLACSICRQEKNSPFLAHQLENRSMSHHVHQTCLNSWMKIKAECPECRRRFNPIDIRILNLAYQPSLQEDLIRSAKVGGALATLPALLFLALKAVEKVVETHHSSVVRDPYNPVAVLEKATPSLMLALFVVAFTTHLLFSRKFRLNI